VLKLHNKKYKQEISKIKNRINKEENNAFYMCKYACARIDFDKAIGMNFKCPECGLLMNPQDNKRTIEVLNDKLKELQETVS
jgi:transcription initiation factor IIE alpha subunit